MIENESGEDYLEAVLELSKTEKDVHSVDIARKLGVSKPAVTKAIKILKGKGFVDVVSNHIVLTKSGEQYAKEVLEKHNNITAFLTKLGVDSQTAETDACRLEHLISKETYSAILNFIKK